MDIIFTKVSNLRNDRFKKKLSIAIFACILVYLSINLLAYVNFLPQFTKYFAYNTTSGTIIRIITSIIFLMPCFVGGIIYLDDSGKRWIVIFTIFILLISINIFFMPTSFVTLYKTSQLYYFMAELDIVVSTKKILIMHASFIVDILFGYAFFFVLPKLLSKKYLFIILSIFNLIILISCFYSMIIEKDYYVWFLSGNWSYTSDTIGSFFGNKQQWGLFLISAIPSIAISFYLLAKRKINFIIKIGISFIYSISALLIMFCGTVAFCKTAIVCNIVFVVTLIIGFSIHMLRNKKTIALSFLIFSIFIGSIIYVVCVMNLPSLQTSKIGKMIYNTISTLFVRGEGSILVRLELMYFVFQNFPSANLMFGITKGLVDPFVRSLIPELVVGLHTGYAIYFGRTGIIGFVIFVILNIYLFRGVGILVKRKPFLATILIASYLSSVVLSLSESEILIFSSSMNGFVFNLLLVSYLLKESTLVEEGVHEKIICTPY